MSMKKIPIGEASNKQLLEFAQTVMSLDVREGTGTGHLLAKIRAAQPDIAEIIVADTPPAAPVAATPAPDRPEGADQDIAATTRAEGRQPGVSHHFDPKVRIIIPNQEKPGGQLDVQVSVNGVQFILKREVELNIPYRVYETLRLAKEKHFLQVWKSPTERPETIETEVLSYPFNVIEMPPKAEVDAYNARTAAVELAA